METMFHPPLIVWLAAALVGAASVGFANAQTPTDIGTVNVSSDSVNTTDFNAQLNALVAQLQSYKLQQEQLNQTLASLQQRLTSLESDTNADLATLQASLSSQSVTAANLARQLSVQQLFVEERIRSDGHSGIKRVRGSQDGTKAYYQNKMTSASTVISAHDHSNYNNTPGLGEFIAVLNGVEFRTRHNDYKLVKPSTSRTYQATQPIPPPEVPPQVLAKQNVSDQITEMRAWFKAWQDQNYTVRDYRNYFKPIMCYLEGAWTQSTVKINEPFSSERHAIDAQSWIELTNKIEFTSYTGRKNIKENYAFLPTKIVDFINGTPVYAQWNYRILCHPISFDLPLKVFQAVDELSTRLKFSMRYDQLAASKLARFRVGPSTNWDGKNSGYSYSSLMEKIMSEIPGADNYGGNITDNVLFNTALNPTCANQPLNAAYYHRWSCLQTPDAMGLSLTRSGFNDENLFVALTNQVKVVAKKVTDCYNSSTSSCVTFSQRVTYAIPLEIIYLTPLMSWNPYNLRSNPASVVVQGGARDGSPSRPYNGTNEVGYFYRTPVEFFSGGEIDKNPADTSLGQVTVLGDNGNAYNVTASGIRIFHPNVQTVGVCRQRYAVFPAHEEGGAIYSELEAIKDALMDQRTYQQLYRQPANSSIPVNTFLAGVTLVTNIAPVPMPHEHTIDLTAGERDILLQGGTVEKVSSISEGHNHVIVVGWSSGNDTATSTYLIVSCGGTPLACRDGHNSLRLNSN